MFTVEEVEQLMRDAAHNDVCPACRHMPADGTCERNDFDCDNCGESGCKCKDCTEQRQNFSLKQSEQKNGWIRCDANRSKSYNWFCPHCGEKVNYIGGGRECEYRYCPWCGKEVGK